MCCNGIMPHPLLNSSVLRRLQKDGDADEDKSRMATGRELQVAGPQRVKLFDL